jgi:hypothetical protein
MLENRCSNSYGVRREGVSILLICPSAQSHLIASGPFATKECYGRIIRFRLFKVS